MMQLDCSEIIPGRLWIGAYLHEQDIEELQRLGVTTVLSLQSEEDLQNYGIQIDLLEQALEKAGIELRRVPIQDFDREALARGLPEAVAVLDELLSEPWTQVYLHCTAGINRAPTTAAGYLILSSGISATAACRKVQECRYCSPPLDILERYEASLKR